MKIFKNIVLDTVPPENKNNLWLYPIDADDGQYELKVFATIKRDNSVSPQWVTIGTGSYNPDTPTPTPPPVIIDDWYVLNGVKEITDWSSVNLNNPITSASYTVNSIKVGYMYLILNTNQNLSSVKSIDTQEDITRDFVYNQISINEKNYKVYSIIQNLEVESRYKITITQNG